MAFDNDTRNRLSKFVTEARKLLSDEFAYQLRNIYGLDPDTGDVTAVDSLPTLSDRDRLTAEILRELFEHYLANAPKRTSKTSGEILNRIVREQAFTVLNRLCAIRMAEARELIIESIAKGYQSKGFQLYARLAGHALGETGEAYVAYIFSLFDECALDLPVLFDRFDEHGRLFPRETVLLKVLDELNHHELEHLWAEDETIGWIYQYFNSKEERKAMRDASQAPRNSRELAVRNQFFTPRYVVEFLTDNTLGRIWYEMRRGDTRLKDQCQYLVRRPNEIFLTDEYLETFRDSFEDASWIDQVVSGDFSALPESCSIDQIQAIALLIDGYRIAEQRQLGDLSDYVNPIIKRIDDGGSPKDAIDAWLCLYLYQRGVLRHGQYGQDAIDRAHLLYNKLREQLTHEPADLSQEELLNQPVFIPPRPFKDPREIRMLDPACGSMHFGLYAFDLFETIYREAWDFGLVSKEEFGLRSQPAILEQTIKPDPNSTPVSNYSSKSVPFEDAFVVVAERPDGGDGVEAGIPYLVESEQKFRVPFLHRVPLRDFDYQRAITAKWFDAAAGLSFVRSTEAFDYEAFPVLSEDEARAEFERQIPRLIIEHNIHGIDIDPRAVQIAGLSLWLRAQRAWKSQGIAAGDRPQVTRSNIVCAEPMPGDQQQLEAFCKELHPAIAQMVTAIFEEMKLAGEAGSLLKIEQEIKSLVAAAKKQFQDNPPDKKTQMQLFGGVQVVKEQQLEFDLSGITDEQFFEKAEEDIYEALRKYASETSEGGFRRKLFAGDAERGFAFIELCRKHFDVALMNPPFGVGAESTNEYLMTNYPVGWENAICSFMQRCEGLTNHESGEVGAILDDTWSIKKEYGEFRREVILRHDLRAYVHLGWGVLDANVETSACVLSHAGVHDTAILAVGNEEDKGEHVFQQCLQLNHGDRRFVNQAAFMHTPNNAITHSISEAILRLLAVEPRIDKQLGEAKNGMKPADNVRFIRASWEVPPASITSQGPWKPCHNGSPYSPFHYPSVFVARYTRRFKHLDAIKNARTTNSEFYGKPGLTYGKRTDFMYAYVMEKGHLFTNEGQAVFYDQPEQKWQLLAILNSSFAQEFINHFCGQHKTSWYVNELRIPTGITPSVGCNAREIHEHLTQVANLTGMPWAEQRVLGNDLRQIAEKIDAEQQLALELYETIDRALIDAIPLASEFSGGKREIDFYGIYLGTRSGTTLERVALTAICEAVDTAFAASGTAGILADDASEELDIVDLVVKAFESANADLEACLAILRSDELRSCLNVKFFPEHTDRYSRSARKAPIYWPISTESGSYTLWFYYHRLTDQTLYKAVNDFVDPKLKQTLRQLTDLRASKDRTSSQEKELAQLTELESELEQFKADLVRIAAFWKPNLNDGVQITAAPLWKFFRLPKWRNKLKKTWEDLGAGKYDWAHLALSIWPDRVVREKCTTDRSIAIAHDLEEQLWHQVEITKVSRGGKETTKLEWQPKELTDAELDSIVEEIKGRK